MRLRSPMPELNGATKWLNGRVRREDLVGSWPTLIHFWSISCEMCKESLYVINRFKNQYAGELAVLAVHMPLTEGDKDISKIEKAALKYHIDHPILIDSDRKLSYLFQNQYVPAYYLFDRSGLLRHYQVGDSGLSMLNQRIQRIIHEY